MSLYNLLFGENPFSGALLNLLGVTRDGVPRYRDCYLNEKGRIVIHTRTGGGNRDFYEHEERCRNEYPEYFNGKDDPSGPWNADLRKLPGFLYDEDDDYDCTYADFYYEPAPEHKKLIETLQELGGVSNPSERWRALLADLEKGDKEKPEVQNALKVGQQIFEKLEAVSTAQRQGGVRDEF